MRLLIGECLSANAAAEVVCLIGRQSAGYLPPGQRWRFRPVERQVSECSFDMAIDLVPTVLAMR